MAQFLHASIQIREPGSSPPSYIDVTQYVDNISLDHGNVQQVGTESGGGDGVVKTLTLNLISTNNYNLSPFDETSPANIYNAEYHPLLSEMSEIIIWVAKTESKNPPAPESADWYLFFRGYVDAVTVNGARVTCNARDPAGILQDTFVEQPTEFPLTQQDEPLHVVLQQMLDELVPENITIYTPSGTSAQPIHPNEAPEFMVRYPGPDEERYGLEDESVWSGLQAAVTQAGWFLGYRYHDPDDPDTPPDIRLVLLEPPVDAGPNTDPATVPGWNHWEYGPEHDFIISPQAGRTLDYIRNVVEIDYSDDHVMRPPVIRFDQDSIDRYRRRYMKITRHNCRLVKYEAEAIKMAEWALYDLKDPFGTFSAEGFFEPGMQVFDGITYLDSRISAGFQFMAVQSIRHTLKFGDRPSFRTRVEGQASVKGGRMKWLWIESRPEADPSIKEDEVGTRKPMIPPQQLYAESIVGGIGVKFDRPQSRRWADTGIWIQEAGQTQTREFYTRARATHFEITSDIAIGQEYEVILVNYDESGNTSVEVMSDPVVAHAYPDYEVDIPGDPSFDATSGYDAEGLVLTWTHTTYASGYELRYDTNFGTSDANMIARTASNRYVFVPGNRNVTVYIKAYNINFEFSTNYDSIARNNPAPVQIAAPVIDNAYYTAKISWSALHATDQTVINYLLEVDVAGSVSEHHASLRTTHEMTFDGPQTVRARVLVYDYQGAGTWSAWSAYYDVKYPAPTKPTGFNGQIVYDTELWWDASEHAEHYELKILWNDGEPQQDTITVKSTRERITPIKGIRVYDFEIRAVNREGVKSAEETLNLSKSAPAAATPGLLDVISFFSAIRGTVNASASSGITKYEVKYQIGTETPDSVFAEESERVYMPAESGTELKIQVRAYDVIGPGIWSTEQTATTSALTEITQFASSLSPPELVDILPTLPDEDYPEEVLVVLTTNKRLYRNYDSNWADYVEDLPVLPDVDYPVGSYVILKDTAEVYENVADVWNLVDTVEQLTVFQNVVAATVVAGAISAIEIAAESITAEHFGVGELEAHVATIEEAFIDSAHVISLDANKITTGTLDADFVDVVNLNANNIVAGSLDASVITVTNLDANNITTGTIDADVINVEAGGGQIIIDSDGVWAYAGGSKQAGFDHDGEWKAGGGAIKANAQGLFGYDNEDLMFEIVPSTGNVYLRGTLRARTLIIPVRPG